MILGPWDTPIKIYNEKDYLTQITFIDHHAQYEVSRIWINEKLLYLRVWWGRILATDLIWDAEKEEFICKEMSIWGQGSFQQFQQMKHLRQKTIKCPKKE